jgi:DNA/RNA endonuclease YhcR with UshA esterase domain
MRKMMFTLAAVLTGSLAFCQVTVSVDSLASHVGEKVTVCDRVYSTRFLSQSASQPTFLNVGAAYPNSPLTIVIFGDDRKNFKQPPEEAFSGKAICVTGIVKQYKGKAEIVVQTEDQLVIQK